MSPGIFSTTATQMDEGESAICRVAARPYNPPASAEAATGAAQHHSALPRPPRLRPDLSRSRSPRGQRIGTQIDPVVSGGRSGRACRPRGDVTAKVSDCTQSPCGNVVARPDLLVSPALADRMESRRSRAMLEALTQLSQLCRVIAAARMQPKQFSTRLSSRHPDDL
jgi:hypothetical protein